MPFPLLAVNSALTHDSTRPLTAIQNVQDDAAARDDRVLVPLAVFHIGAELRTVADGAHQVRRICRARFGPPGRARR